MNMSPSLSTCISLFLNAANTILISIDMQSPPAHVYYSLLQHGFVSKLYDIPNISSFDCYHNGTTKSTNIRITVLNRNDLDLFDESFSIHHHKLISGPNEKHLLPLDDEMIFISREKTQANKMTQERQQPKIATPTATKQSL